MAVLAVACPPGSWLAGRGGSTRRSARDRGEPAAQGACGAGCRPALLAGWWPGRECWRRGIEGEAEGRGGFGRWAADGPLRQMGAGGVGSCLGAQGHSPQGSCAEMPSLVYSVARGSSFRERRALGQAEAEDGSTGWRRGGTRPRDHRNMVYRLVAGVRHHPSH
ncbi:hypothetical protein C2845_PM08G02710 [Panicum miliaceum]|uniref:Uncharacterized protein n=1 Tax=Panicum miliaceum TaxID=4540 RepID=A0A3L6QZP0_PANMI|nr:hypothetical protein C2845_PM08G02710 [Panicum miliaceum]